MISNPCLRICIHGERRCIECEKHARAKITTRLVELETELAALRRVAEAAQAYQMAPNRFARQLARSALCVALDALPKEGT